MGINLSRFDDGEEWTCSNALWSFILETATMQGWKPLGTYQFIEGTEDINNGWDKNDYHTNQGQGVTQEDVENMLQSLNDYLANNKNHNSIEIEIIKSFINFVQNHDGVNGFEIY